MVFGDWIDFQRVYQFDLDDTSLEGLVAALEAASISSPAILMDMIVEYSFEELDAIAKALSPVNRLNLLRVLRHVGYRKAIELCPSEIAGRLLNLGVITEESAKIIVANGFTGRHLSDMEVDDVVSSGVVQFTGIARSLLSCLKKWNVFGFRSEKVSNVTGNAIAAKSEIAEPVAAKVSLSGDVPAQLTVASLTGNKNKRIAEEVAESAAKRRIIGVELLIPDSPSQSEHGIPQPAVWAADVNDIKENLTRIRSPCSNSVVCGFRYFTEAILSTSSLSGKTVRRWEQCGLLEAVLAFFQEAQQQVRLPCGQHVVYPLQPSLTAFVAFFQLYLPLMDEKAVDFLLRRNFAVLYAHMLRAAKDSSTIDRNLEEANKYLCSYLSIVSSLYSSASVKEEHRGLLDAAFRSDRFLQNIQKSINASHSDEVVHELFKVVHAVFARKGATATPLTVDLRSFLRYAYGLTESARLTPVFLSQCIQPMLRSEDRAMQSAVIEVLVQFVDRTQLPGHIRSLLLDLLPLVEPAEGTQPSFAAATYAQVAEIVRRLTRSDGVLKVLMDVKAYHALLKLKRLNGGEYEPLRQEICLCLAAAIRCATEAQIESYFGGDFKLAVSVIAFFLCWLHDKHDEIEGSKGWSETAVLICRELVRLSEDLRMFDAVLEEIDGDSWMAVFEAFARSAHQGELTTLARKLLPLKKSSRQEEIIVQSPPPLALQLPKSVRSSDAAPKTGEERSRLVKEALSKLKDGRWCDTHFTQLGWRWMYPKTRAGGRKNNETIYVPPWRVEELVDEERRKLRDLTGYRVNEDYFVGRDVLRAYILRHGFRDTPVNAREAAAVRMNDAVSKFAATPSRKLDDEEFCF